MNDCLLTVRPDDFEVKPIACDVTIDRVDEIGELKVRRTIHVDGCTPEDVYKALSDSIERMMGE